MGEILDSPLVIALVSCFAMNHYEIMLAAIIVAEYSKQNKQDF